MLESSQILLPVCHRVLFNRALPLVLWAVMCAGVQSEPCMQSTTTLVVTQRVQDSGRSSFLPCAEFSKAQCQKWAGEVVGCVYFNI